MSAALLSPLIAVGALVVGWFVLGTQRVAEDLTKERRLAYAEVLKQAEAHERGGATDSALREAIRKADFLSSNQMFRAARLPALLSSAGTDTWSSELEWFTELARIESHRNSSLRTWTHRKRYHQRLERSSRFPANDNTATQRTPATNSRD